MHSINNSDNKENPVYSSVFGTAGPLKIVLLGDPSVGKTSIIERYVHGKFESGYNSTLGFDYYQKSIKLENQNVKITIWDTLGQERFRLKNNLAYTLGSAFFRGVNGCIFVFDVNEWGSFNSITKWKNSFYRNADIEGKYQDEFPIVVIGNKIDIETQTNEDSVAKFAKLWCEKRNIPYFDASAKNDENISQAFEKLVKMINKIMDKDLINDLENVMENIDQTRELIRKKNNCKNCMTSKGIS